MSDHDESDLIPLALRGDRKTWRCLMHPSGEPYPHVHKNGPCPLEEDDA